MEDEPRGREFVRLPRQSDMARMSGRIIQGFNRSDRHRLLSKRLITLTKNGISITKEPVLYALAPPDFHVDLLVVRGLS